MIRSKKIRDSARDQTCLINSPICNGNTNTTVWCHSNCGDDGKGWGQKAEDLLGAHGCSCCHDYVDGRRNVPTDHRGYYDLVNTKQERNWYLDRGIKRTILRLFDMGRLVIK